MEKKDNLPSLVIGDSQFGLTQKDVTTTIAELQNKIAAARDLLNDPDERLRIAGQSLLSSQEKAMKALTLDTPDAILDKVLSIYNKVKTLERTGAPRKDIATQINQEFPEINDLYILTSRQGWGYELGQEVKGLQFDAITK